MKNQPRQSSSSLPGAPIFLADQLHAAGHDPANMPELLRKGDGTAHIASPTGVRIRLSLVDDRIRVDQIVFKEGVKVLCVDNDYQVFLAWPHNGLPKTIEATLPGRPISDLFKAPGFDRHDITIDTVTTLHSGTLLIRLICPREPD